MRAFIAVPGGYACELERAELRIIARVVADTAELLGSPIDGGADDAAPATPSSSDDAVLAALDWDPAAGDTPRDPALARLLPPASDDDELASEMRRLTEGSLRATKVDQLRVVHRTLEASTGVVIVREGEERPWLAALTDLRLVLAARLGIETDDDAERVYERAGSSRPQTAVDELDAALTSLYAALTWWQESLLEAMSGARP
ncbi:DUF2017 family protein [Georgenia sp. H159]|uniref:DUF2017 family protein n=1 Tax=Georgenia sp. H159 TaxID=3076115 RepID=UPI002D764C6B|nr:DUF2017 family protein [Georgenia sp. H159]